MDRLQLYGTKGNILLITDEVQTLRTLSGIIIEQGHMVRVEKDSTAALMAIDSQPPDLILLGSTPVTDEDQVYRKLN